MAATLAATAGTVIIAVGGVASAPSARAADVTSDVTLSNPTLVGAAPARVYDPFEAQLDWSVPDNTVHAGDTFTVAYGPKVSGYADSFALQDSAGAAIANCTSTTTQLTCTFTSYVTTHNTKLAGTVDLWFQATAQTTDPQLPLITTGPSPIAIPIPNGIGPAVPADYSSLGKYGLIGAADGNIYWYLNFPASQVTAADGSDVTIVDTFDSRLSCPIASSVMLLDRPAGTPVTPLAALPQGSSDGQYTYSCDAATNTLSFTYHGASHLAPNYQFQAQYQMATPAGTTAGTLFTNSATATSTVHATVEYFTSSGTGNGQGKGGVTVTKTDSADPTQFLSGAVFELLDASGAPVTFTDSTGASATTMTTDANGSASAFNLDPGSYTLHEVTAPANYELSADQVVTVVGGSQAAAAVSDTVIPPTPTPTPTTSTPVPTSSAPASTSSAPASTSSSAVATSSAALSTTSSTEPVVDTGKPGNGSSASLFEVVAGVGLLLLAAGLLLLTGLHHRRRGAQHAG